MTRYSFAQRQMTLPAPTYDLVLLLDPQSEETARAKIVADARAAIEAQGELLRHDDWGERALTYPIDRKPNAEYHLLQFHAGASSLLDGLNRSLRITDGVMRFRIIKLKPGVPDAPEMAPSSAVKRSEPEAEAAGSTPQPQAHATEVADAPAVPEAATPEAAASEPAAPAASEPAAATDAAPAAEPAVGDPA